MREGERVRGACSALWRREAGGASQPLISTWRGGRCHLLLQVRLTLESDVPKDRQPGRVASEANPYVLELQSPLPFVGQRAGSGSPGGVQEGAQRPRVGKAGRRAGAQVRPGPHQSSMEGIHQPQFAGLRSGSR